MISAYRDVWRKSVLRHLSRSGVHTCIFSNSETHLSTIAFNFVNSIHILLMYYAEVISTIIEVISARSAAYSDGIVFPFK